MNEKLVNTLKNNNKRIIFYKSKVMCSNRLAQAKRLRTLSIDSRALPNPPEPRRGFRTFYSSLSLSPSLQNLRQANPLLLLLQDNPRYIIPPNSPNISTAGKKIKKIPKIGEQLLSNFGDYSRNGSHDR